MAIIPSDEKVIMVSSTANTTYSGSKALKETAEWYTMQDIIDTIPPVSSVNIYNSDGTLTSDRTLIGNNKNLDFNGTNNFSVTNSNNIKLETFVGNKRLRFDNLSGNRLELSAFNLGTGNVTSLHCEDNIILTNYNNNRRGFYFDFANRVYSLGQLEGNNKTFLRIDDAAEFPVQVSGTNVAQNTSGASSGKFLKIKVDGVDYVIELKNPS